MPTITLPPDMPSTMRQLPRDEVGRPVPFFVAKVNGVYDFRIMDPAHMLECITDQLCWTCGHRLNRVRGGNAPRGTFVAGPMCLINRTSAEPPSHTACAEWAAKACPFLAKPAKVRREGGLPDAALDEAPGLMLTRNPGVTALIDSERWRYYQVDGDPEIGSKGGILCQFARVVNVQWMREGRQAREPEVLDSLDSGLPTLMEISHKDPGGPRALAAKTRDALRWIGGFDPTAYPNIAATLQEL